jgi:hypothetical protein
MATACLETVRRAVRTMRKLQRDELNSGRRPSPDLCARLAEAERVVDQLVAESPVPANWRDDAPHATDGNQP